PSPAVLPPSPPSGEREGGRGLLHGKSPFVFRMHWDPEPNWHPSPCPLPARRGEGGRRPGEGPVHGGNSCRQLLRFRGFVGLRRFGVLMLPSMPKHNTSGDPEREQSHRRADHH